MTGPAPGHAGAAPDGPVPGGGPATPHVEPYAPGPGPGPAAPPPAPPAAPPHVPDAAPHPATGPHADARAAAPWWALDRSLRTRLVAAAMAAVVVAVTGVVVVAYVAVRREVRGTFDEQLRRQARGLRQQAVPGNPFGIHIESRIGEIGGYAQVVRADGRTGRPDEQTELPVTDADLAVALRPGYEVIRDETVDGRRVRMLTTHLFPRHAIQVALPLAAVEDQLRRLTAVFLLVAGVGLAMAAGLAMLVARRALAPVSGLTDAAERIAETRDLTLRIDESRHDELGRLAASFNTMLSALESSVGAQRRLVADASHELRTPLASLRTNVELLRQVDEMAPGVREDVVAAIVGQLEELTSLVSDVVELARGDEPVDAWDDVALDDLVERAVERARRHWPSATFTVSTVPVNVRGVARRIDRAVANLLDNAAKFGGADAAVDVRLDATGRLAVHDNGPGVPEEALPHVFGRFYRAEEARALPGSGLGLAIVKQFAESHRGRVSLRNAPDGGTVAELWLPPTMTKPP